MRDAASSRERLGDERVRMRGELFGGDRRLGQHAGPAQDLGDGQRRGAGRACCTSAAARASCPTRREVDRQAGGARRRPG